MAASCMLWKGLVDHIPTVSTKREGEMEARCVLCHETLESEQERSNSKGGSTHTQEKTQRFG